MFEYLFVPSKTITPQSRKGLLRFNENEKKKILLRNKKNKRTGIRNTEDNN